MAAARVSALDACRLQTVAAWVAAPPLFSAAAAICSAPRMASLSGVRIESALPRISMAACGEFQHLGLDGGKAGDYRAALLIFGFRRCNRLLQVRGGPSWSGS